MKRAKKKIIFVAKKTFHKLKNIFRGFTIIELIVVISIIGVIASIVLVSVSSYIGKSRDSRIKAEVSEIAKEATTYYVDNFSYSGYSISDSFIPVSSGSDYVFLSDGVGTYVVYAKLTTSDNYWCADSTGATNQIENPPDIEVYACLSGSGVGGVVCDNNGLCDSENENNANCSSDCYCGDGLCHFEDEDSSNCSEDCVTGAYCGGSGIAGDPYQICDCISLQSVEDNLSAYFILTNNISCSGVSFNPLSNFSGDLNGNGKKITNLSIGSSLQSVGLVGTNNGSIHNLGLEITIFDSASQYKGSFAGINNGNINSSYSICTITTTGQYAGGITGENRGTIENSYVVCTINATGQYAGGISGFNNPGAEYGIGIIRNSYADVSLSGGSYSGGIVGSNQYAGGIIKDSFASGTVSGSFPGGIAGYDDANALMDNLYWTDSSRNACGAGWSSCDNTPNLTNLSDLYSFDHLVYSNWPSDVWSWSESSLPTLK
jgi:prepilin-type N-terminal cleavage/methylation domain-containing protein